MSEEKVNTEEKEEEKEEKKEKPIPFMEEVPFFKDQEYIVLSNKGIDPESIDDYIANDGYVGAAKAVLEMTDVEIIEEMKGGNDRARMAFDVFCYRIQKYIGAYAAVMGGLDAIVFTGGIGENAPLVREKVLSDLAFLGVKLDTGMNAWKSDSERAIHAEDSKVAVIVIPTNEELVIALDTERIVGENRGKATK